MLYGVHLIKCCNLYSHQVDGQDLMGIPAKDPIKFCLQAMDILFTKDEMKASRFKATRPRGSNKPLPVLNQAKVKLIDGNNFITTT